MQFLCFYRGTNLLNYIFSILFFLFFFLNDTAPPEIYPLPLHDPLPIFRTQSMRVQTLALMLTLLAACGKRQTAPPATIQSRVALARAANCDSLQQQVQETAVRQMRSELDGAKRGTGLYGIGFGGAGGATPQPAAGPASYTTTNTQVAGVDESDFVKNDGTRILVLSGRTLFTAASWPPQSLSIAGQLEIEGWPTTMFLEGNQAVVFSSIWTVPAGGGA